MSGKARTMGKRRDKDQPYVTVVASGAWEWRILKDYENPNKPFARVYTAVKSPFTMGGFDIGDTYWADIRGRITQLDPLVTAADLPKHLWPALQAYYDDAREVEPQTADYDAPAGAGDDVEAYRG